MSHRGGIGFYMKSKDVFNVAMRIIGLLFLYQGLSAVPTALASICPVFPHFIFRNLVPSLFMVGWPLAIAYWLVRGAPWLMRLAYRDEPRSSETMSRTPTTGPFSGPGPAA
jgi:hypothetical protein